MDRFLASITSVQLAEWEALHRVWAEEREERALVQRVLDRANR